MSLFRTLTNVIVLSSWLVCATPTWSAERVILGNAKANALAASADPDTGRTLDFLRQKATQRGAIRVIVGLRVAFAPEGLMTTASRSQQRSEIDAAHSAILERVPTLKLRPQSIRRFATIPFMALEATSAELEKLAGFSEITSIAEDRLLVHHLAQSVPQIGAASAWASGYTGAGQTVAILDTGVDKTHPFLTGRVVSEACYSSAYAPDGASTLCPGGVTASTSTGSALPYAGNCPAGECDHGTHVAGIAVGSNASFAGVAKGASVIAIQVFSRIDGRANCGGPSSCTSAYDSDIVRGLERVYALRNSYRIAAVNMSLGGGRYRTQYACESDFSNTPTKTAIDNLRAANIATVISSGNDGYTSSMSAPACISSAVSVGATWDSYYGYGLNCTDNAAPSNYIDYGGVDKVACFSNSASFLNLLAPGVWINSSIPYGGYSDYSGTSMAAPHVTGAWAVLKQKAPAATVTEVLAALNSSGVAVFDARNGVTKPRINLSAALNSLGTGASFTLSAAKSGTGSGSVSSSPSGISCGSTCSASYASGASVTLTATPATGSTFSGWSGACSGTGSCVVSMSAARSVTAGFMIAPANYTLSVGKAGTGSGTVSSNPTGIACGAICDASFAEGTSVSLSAAATVGGAFGGWGGACLGMGACTVSMTSAHSVSATFVVNPSGSTGLLSFASSSQSVMENAGNATLSVSRSGGSSGAASVSYSIMAGTAAPGVDYVSASGSLNWTSGDASQRTISVPIINNTVRNTRARSFSVNLSGASGSALGSTSSVIVNIHDDDGASAPWLDVLLLGN